MTRVKICGIKREEDIRSVNMFLPEYIGFVFASSKRRVSPKEARGLTTCLDKRIKTAGVFVNEEIGRLVEVTVDCGLDVVQIHGDESPEYIRKLKVELDLKNTSGKQIEIWKAIRVKDAACLERTSDFDVDALVLDVYVEESYGGAGKAFDWNLAAEAGKYKRVILAGGLNTFNIQEAVGIVQPFAVDVSSGVERDGVKDELMIRDFIYTARSNSY